MVRQAGTGLFMVQMDRLLLEEYLDGNPDVLDMVAERYKANADDSECEMYNSDCEVPFPGWTPEYDRPDFDRVGDRATVDRAQLQERQTIVVSCGALTFESTSEATRHSRAFADYIDLPPGADPDGCRYIFLI